jgi:lipopolysaccharide transport protein LptA
VCWSTDSTWRRVSLAALGCLAVAAATAAPDPAAPPASPASSTAAPPAAAPPAAAPAATAAAAAGSAANDASGASAAAPALAPPPPAPPCDEPLCYTATSLEAERNHIALTDIHIVDTTRGITQIKADRAEATGLDLGNSRWILTGHVQVFMPQQQLLANTATIQFTDKHIASIDADGTPAEFEHQVPRNTQEGPATTTVTGHALQIDYDLGRDQVQLTGNSWLTDGCNDISTQQITYDIATQRVVAAAVPGGTSRVHGTIRTHTGAPCIPGAGRP